MTNFCFTYKLSKEKKVSDSYCVKCKEMFVTNKEGFK